MNHMPALAAEINGINQQISVLDWDWVKNRTVRIYGEIDDYTAMTVVSMLRYLESISDDDIKLEINSVGGSVSAGLDIIDEMHCCRCDISTLVRGVAASMGAVIAAAGTKGKRFALPHSRIMIHQPSAGTQGRVSDMEINIEHFIEIKHLLNRMMSEFCGRSVKRIASDSEHDLWLTAEAAAAYGLIDAIREQRRGENRDL